ncbi:MAG: RHS repeat protein, partial [Planctomycetaceae bacterium]|nr:RHS repeat protein [Planctomycetaceae bacterium]
MELTFAPEIEELPPETKLLSLSGDAPVRSADTPFGTLGPGWELAGVPYLIVDTRRPATNGIGVKTDNSPGANDESNSLDDVVALMWPGGGFTYFTGIHREVVTAGQKEIKYFRPTNPVTGALDSDELGTLVQIVEEDGNHWVYSAADGSEWQFDDSGTYWTGPDNSEKQEGYNGLPAKYTSPEGIVTDFQTYSQMDEFDNLEERIERITPYSSIEDDLQYTEFKALNSAPTTEILLPFIGPEVPGETAHRRQIIFTRVSSSDSRITNIQIKNGSEVVYERAFTYLGNLITSDTIGTQDGGKIVTSFEYANNLIKRITVGTNGEFDFDSDPTTTADIIYKSAIYEIQAARPLGYASDGAIVALLAGTPVGEIRQIFHEVTPGSPTTELTEGTDLTLGSEKITGKYLFDDRGRILRHDEVVTNTAGSITTTETWDRDWHGSVIRYVDGATYLNGNETSPGRATTFTYDYEDRSQINSSDDTIPVNGRKGFDGAAPLVPNAPDLGKAPPVRHANLVSTFANYTQELYTYDDFGFLATRTDAEGNVWNYKRDLKHRLVELSGPMGYLEKWFYATFHDATDPNLHIPDVLVFHVSPIGIVTNYQYRYEDSRRVSKIITGTGGTVDENPLYTFSYPNTGNIDQYIWFGGTDNTITEFTYSNSGFGNPTQIEVKGYYTPNPSSPATLVTLSTTTRTYDALNNLLTEEIKDRNPDTGSLDIVSKSSYDYYNSGLLRAVNDGRTEQLDTASIGKDIFTTFTYDTLGRASVVRENQFQFDNTPGYYYADGAGSTRITKTEYYRGGEVKKIITPNGQKTNFSYNPSDRTVSQTSDQISIGGSLTNRMIETTYDQYGRAVDTLDFVSGAHSTYKYDRFDQLISSTEHGVVLSVGTSVVADISSEYNYDALGRLVKQQSGITGSGNTRAESLAASHTRYNPLGFIDFTSVVAPGGAVYEFFTDSIGNVTRSIEQRRNSPTSDPLLYETKSTYDDLGRIATVTSPIDPGSPNTGTSVVTTTEYDTLGRTVTTTSTLSPGSSSVTTYDIFGRVRKQVNPDGSVLTNTYNLAGDLVDTLLDFDGDPGNNSASDANFRRNYFEYDSFGRLSRSYQAVNPTGTDVNDLLVATIYEDEVFGSNGLSAVITTSQVKRDSDPDNSILFAPKTVTYLDAEGKTVEIVQNDPGPGPESGPITTITYTYDASNRTMQILTTDPTGALSLSVSNQLGMVLESYQGTASSTALGAADRLLDQYDYDPNGRVLVHRHRTGTSASQDFELTTLGYDDATGLIATKSLGTQANGSLNKVEQKFDSSGNLIKTTDGLGNVTTFTYDGLGRILTETTAVDMFTPGTLAPTDQTDVTRKWFYNQQAVLYKNRNDEYILRIADPNQNIVHEFWFAATTNDTQITAMKQANTLALVLGLSVQPVKTFRTEMNPDGTLKSITEFDDADFNNALAVNSFLYDSYGRQTNETQSGNLNTVAGSYARTPASLTTSWYDFGVRNQLGVTIDFANGGAPIPVNVGTFTQHIDDLGRVTSIEHDTEAIAAASSWVNNVAPSQKLFRFEYDAAGRTQSIERFRSPEATLPAGYTRFRYEDVTGRLDGIAHFKQASDYTSALSGNIATFVLLRDASGRIFSKTTTYKNPNDNTDYLDETRHYH